MTYNLDGKQIIEECASGAIYTYKNGIPDSLCDVIHNFYYDNLSITSPGVTVGGQNVDVKKTFDINQPEKMPEDLYKRYMEIDNEIYQSLKVVTQMYMSRFDWLKKAPNLRDTGYLWQMYVKNEGYYQEHTDGEQWNEDVRRRVLAVIVYVNTVAEGGETYFRYQDVSVKPEKGKVTLFPTDWYHAHQAKTPISENKLILSSFIEFNY